MYNFMQGLKPDPSLVSFYAVAAEQRYTSSLCNGTYSFIGGRYFELAEMINFSTPEFTNGAGFNICGNELNNIFSLIQSQMQNAVINVECDMVAIPTDRGQPDPASIVLKINGSTVPANDPVNGWSLGISGNGDFSQQSAETCYFPPPVNQRTNTQTGYILQLNGNAVYKGGDTIEIQYETL